MGAIHLLRRMAQRMAGAKERGDRLLFALLLPPFFTILGTSWIVFTIRTWLCPHRNTTTAELRPGFVMHGDITDMVFLYAAIFGEWEPGVTSVIRRLVRSDSVFLDIGAHVGYYTLLAKTAGGRSVRTVSVEPASTNLTWLETNLATFPRANTHIVPAAVAAEDGSQPLFTGPAFNRGYTSLSRRLGLRYVGDVKSITLSRLVLDLNMELGDIDVIKIDVEGGELAILAALAESSSQLRSDAVIIAEITSYWVDREELRRILGALHEKGFAFYRIRNAYGPLFYLRWDEPDKVLEPKNWTELLNGKNDVVITKRRLDEL